MRQLEIVFKSGAIIRVDCSEYRFEQFASGRAALNWTTPAGYKRKAIHINLDDVSGLVEVC